MTRWINKSDIIDNIMQWQTDILEVFRYRHAVIIVQLSNEQNKVSIEIVNLILKRVNNP